MKIKQLNTKKHHWLSIATLFLLPYSYAYAALEGKLETVNCDQIKGWAWDNANSTSRVQVNIYDVIGTSSKLLATLTAQTLRSDLLTAGKGDGKYGFTFKLPATIRTGAKHTFSVRFKGTIKELTNSPKTTALACYGKLNDTGIQICGDATTNGLSCPVSSLPGQDADYGRDALAKAGKLKKTGAGNAGFDFTKVANDGSILPASAKLGTGAKNWACTLDNVTGLLWEVKTTDGGLRDMKNTYSWYNPDNKTNGGSVGYQNMGTCTGGISCDTDGYATEVNALQLCGKSDWRVPKRSELLSIVDNSHLAPAIDGTYFPNTGQYDWAWSASPYASHDYGALFVGFSVGDDYYDHKSGSNTVRLVRGGS